MKHSLLVPTFFSVVLFLHAAALPAQAAENTPVFNRAETNQKVVALTFDADLTPKMLRLLARGKVKSWYNQTVTAELTAERVPATLFLTGLWISTYPTSTRELSQNPLFELGNHSYSHGAFRSPCYHLAEQKEPRDISEIQKTDQLLQTYAAQYVKLFRFPGLCSDADDRATAVSAGYTVIGGDVFGGDGFQKDPTKIVAQVLGRVRPGSIVILHLNGGPDAPQTAAALPTIIQGLRERGYTFVKVSDLLNASQ